MLAVRGFRSTCSTTRDVYLDGESFRVEVDDRRRPGRADRPGARRRGPQAGRRRPGGSPSARSQRKAARRPTPRRARARSRFKVDDDAGGPYVVRVAGTDRFGNPIVADRPLTISGKKDETKLRLLADRQTYKVGEEASVNLHSRGRRGHGAPDLGGRPDPLATSSCRSQEGDNPVAWAVDGAQFPNFTLTAARMAGTQFDEARLDVQVERDLRVTVAPTKPVGRARASEVEVEVTTVDQLGRPVAAELSLALVDRSLLRLFGDRLPPIGPFFYDQTRTGGVRDRGDQHVPLRSRRRCRWPEAVVEEAEQQAAAAGQRGRSSGASASRPQRRCSSRSTRPARRRPPRGRRGGTGRLRQRWLPEAAGAARARHDRREGRRWHGLAREGGARARRIGRGRRRQLDGADRWLADERPRTPDRAARAVELGSRPDVAGRAAARPSAAAARAVRRDGLLEPERRHRQGRQGPRHVPGARRPSREYRFTARGVTGADTLVGQTTAELDRPQGLLRRPQGPAAAHPGRQAPVHRPGPPPGRRRARSTLRLTIYAGGREEVYPKTIEVKGDGVEEVLFEPFEVPDGDDVRLTLDRRRWARRRTSWSSRCRSAPGASRRSPRPRARQRRRDGLRRPAAGPGVREPEMLVVVSPTLAADARRAGPGPRRLPARAPVEHRASSRRRRHDGRPRRRPAGGDLGPGLPAGDRRRPARPRPQRLTEPDPGAGRRADRRPERGRRLALGRPATGRRPARGRATG